MFDRLRLPPGYPTPGAALDAMLATDPAGSDADQVLEEILALEKDGVRAGHPGAAGRPVRRAAARATAPATAPVSWGVRR